MLCYVMGTRRRKKVFLKQTQSLGVSGIKRRKVNKYEEMLEAVLGNRARGRGAKTVNKNKGHASCAVLSCVVLCCAELCCVTTSVNVKVRGVHHALLSALGSL